MKPYNRICIEVKRWVFGKNNRGARQEARFATKKKIMRNKTDPSNIAYMGIRVSIFVLQVRVA